ncbi:HAD family hydrolase [Novosphingobium sp.]|uniref:HAD family hydrolase n=1 Tax=Novosphingobium sp. TaxID=1874826 RepID=UPI00333FB441
MNAPFQTQSPPRNRMAAEVPILAPTPPRDACLPHELPMVLDWFSDLRVLSLDCFDTLLWRDCHAPTDLFATLPHINPYQRVHGERQARQAAHAARGVHDIGIDEIYRAIMPHARDADRARAIAAELAAEARHCYGFAPTIALMREAKRRGLQVILVSDTYLGPRQLHDLVAQAAGDDVAALIDRVFCSSTYGKPKAAGLYRDVLPRLKAAPHQILHVGDNHAADVGGVKPFGVHTLHLKQFTAQAAQQLRLESAVAALLQGKGGSRLPASQPHRPALAMAVAQARPPAFQLGYATLGPVLFGFDQWLRSAARALHEARGGVVHWLFLMRDGYLPMRMHQAGGAARSIHAIEISRLTATFATFAQDTAIMRHVEHNRGIDPAILARQLRLPAATIDALCTGRTADPGWTALVEWCRVPENRRPIVKAAQALANRLVAHVRNSVNPAPGDTLMLVDLGYNGSVQSLIDPLLQRALKVHVAGRYLILREMVQSGCDKAGYLDEQHYDPATLNAMTTNVALIEQLATMACGSVIDYADDGTPVRSSNDIGKRQSTVRETVQQGCLAFGDAALAHIRRSGGDTVARAEAINLWRAANAATLMRLMFLPQREELAVVAAFEHDVNLGTAETLALFDPAIAHEGLLQQGLFYQKGVRRMFLPAELAERGFATRLTHFATALFPMPLTAADFADDGGTLAVILSDNHRSTRIDLPIRPTHDGYSALCIPVGASRFVAAIPFGNLAPFVEVHSITALPAREYLDNRHDTHTRQVAVVPQFEGIVPLTDRLWHCPEAGGFVLLPPPPAIDDANMVIVVVFRAIGGTGRTDVFAPDEAGAAA